MTGFVHRRKELAAAGILFSKRKIVSGYKIYICWRNDVIMSQTLYGTYADVSMLETIDEEDGVKVGHLHV